MKNNRNYGIYIFILGSILSALSAGIFEVGIFLFIYPMCLLYSIRNIRNKKMLFIYYLIYLAFMIPKYFNISGGYILLDIIGFIIFSLIEYIPLIIDYFLYLKFKEKVGYLSTFIYPLSYVIIGEMVSIIYPIIELSHSLAPYLYISQIVSLFGSYFLSFLVLLFSTTYLYIIDLIKNKNNYKKPLIISSSVIIIILTFGIIKTYKRVDSFNVRVASILGSDLGDFYGEGFINSPLEEDKRYLEEMVKRAKELNSDILITAEESSELLLNEEEDYKEFVGNLAKEYNIPILISADIYLNEDGSYRKDVIYYFNNEGEFIFEYIKSTLLPYEDNFYLKGDPNPCYLEIDVGSNKLNITSSICYDINNINFISSMNKNTNLLVNQSWCWIEINKIQQNVQLLRTIENGTSFISSTIDASSTYYSYNGIKIDECYRDVKNRRELKIFDVEVPVKRINTFYSNIKDYIPFLYPILFIGILLAFIFKKKFKNTF